MKRHMIGLVAMALAINFAGCATEPGTGANGSAAPNGDGSAKTSKAPPLKKTGLLIEPVDALAIGYSVHWATHISVPNAEKISAAAVLDDLLVTVESPSHIVTAINMKTGRMAWRSKIANPFDNIYTPRRIDQKILVNTETHLYELSALTGKIISRADLTAPVNSAPAIVGEFAIFGGSNGMVFGHDTRTGYAKWRYKLPSQILVPAQVISSQVFIATSSGRYVSFNGRTGEVLWRGKTFARVSATPAISPLGVFVASEDHSLYGLQRATGEDRWIFRYTAPLKHTPQVIRSSLYVTLPTGELVALKATDGKELWRVNTKDKLITNDQNGLVFLGDKKIILRETNTSKVIDQVPTKKLQTILPASDKSLVLISSDGFIVKISPSS